jgi:ABC-type Fe3+/spermidine/putrescine transport system ATPase subunit
MSGTIESLAGAEAIVLLSSGERCIARADGLRSGSAVELSVRPEAVRLGAAAGTDAGTTPGRLQGRIRQSAYLGNFVSYQVTTDGGLELTALTPKGSERMAVDTAIALEWSAGDSLVVAGEPVGIASEEET